MNINEISLLEKIPVKELKYYGCAEKKLQHYIYYKPETDELGVCYNAKDGDYFSCYTPYILEYNV